MCSLSTTHSRQAVFGFLERQPHTLSIMRYRDTIFLRRSGFSLPKHILMLFRRLHPFICNHYTTGYSKIK